MRVLALLLVALVAVARANVAADTLRAGLYGALEANFDVVDGVLVNKRARFKKPVVVMNQGSLRETSATKVLFPHVPKTGGSSLSTLLQIWLRVGGAMRKNASRSVIDCERFTKASLYEEHYGMREAAAFVTGSCPGDSLVVTVVREPVSWLHSGMRHNHQHGECNSKKRLNRARGDVRSMAEDGCRFVSVDNMQTCFLLTDVGGGTITKMLPSPNSPQELCSDPEIRLDFLQHIDVLAFTHELDNLPRVLAGVMQLPEGSVNYGMPRNRNLGKKNFGNVGTEEDFQQLARERFSLDVIMYEEMQRFVSSSLDPTTGAEKV